MKLIYSLLLVLCGAPTLYAQLHPLQTGYDLLIDNHEREARDFFADQLNGSQAAPAALALSVAEGMLDNQAAARAAFLRFVSLEKDADVRNAYLDAFWQPVSQELDRDYFSFLVQQSTNSYTRVGPMADYYLGEHYLLLGDLRKAQEHFDRIGYVRPWRIAGPFENISESGFDREFGVLAHPEDGATFTSKLDVPISWIDVERPDHNGWLRFANHMNTKDAVVYAQTFCKSSAVREATFRLGSSGSVKVWVNDILVFSEFRERNNHLDTYVFSAPLRRGSNRILVQIGTTGDLSPNFLLRLTDGGGEALSDLSFDHTPVAYDVALEWTPRITENPTEAFLAGRLAGGGNIVDVMALSQFYLLNGFHEEARTVVEKALSWYPENHQLLALKRNLLSALGDATGASQIEKRLVEEAPEMKISLITRLNEARNLKDWPLMETLIKDYTRLYGESELTLTQQLLLLGGREESEKMSELVASGLDRYPGSANLALMMAEVESGMRNRPKAAIRTLEKYLKNHRREAVIEKLIDLKYQAGEAAEVVGLFEDLIEYAPNNTNYHSRLSRLYYLTGKKRASQHAMEDALALAPYAGTLRSSQAKLYADAGDTDGAISAYEKALSLDPYDYDSRDALRNLRSESASAFDQLTQVDYYALYANSSGAEAYPNDNSVILAYDVEQIVHEGGASEVRTSVLIKALNSAGVDQWKEYGIPIYSNQQGVVEKIEVLDPDGSRHEASRSGTDVVFDRLAVGGAVHLVYRLRDFKYGRLSGKFWSEHPLSLALPSVRSTYSLLTPRDMPFTVKLTGRENTDLQPVVTDLGDRRLRVWQLLDGPGLQPEASTPDYSDMLTNVRVSNIEDWSFIARWYSELTHAKIRVDDDVRGAVAELFADRPDDLDTREEVETIYRFVTGNIRYISVPFLQSNYIPQSAARTLATRQGDCKDVSSLFVAMCQVRGIKANLVLINTRNRSRAELSLPGTGFNHCIARVKLQGKAYYVELTDENLPFGTGDWSVNNAFALVIPRRGEVFEQPAGLINPATRGVNAVIRTGTLTFEGGDMVFDLHNRRDNSYASNLRSAFRHESEENQRRSMQQAISDDYPRVELQDLSFGAGLDDLSQSSVRYDYSYRAVDPGNRIGGMTIYPLVLSDQFTIPDYTTTAERKLPIDLWSSFRAEYFEQTLEVTAPAGQQLVEAPESVAISNAYFDYSIAFGATEAGLSVRRSLRLKQDLVPAEAYAAFRDDVLRMVEADKVSLAFR